MKPKPSSLLAAAAATALMASSAQAATIVYNFDDNDAVVDANDFGSGVTASDAVVAGSTALITNQRYQRRLGTFDTTLAFTVTIPDTVTIDLTQLSFESGIDSNTGGNDTFGEWNLSISVGSGSPTKWEDSVAGTGESFVTRTSTLSGLTGLSDTTVTFTLQANYGTVDGDPPSGGNNNNRFATIDDITLNGSVVPEPGSLALMGLGGLCVLRRRRQD